MKSKLKAKHICFISVGIVTRLLWDIIQMKWVSYARRVKIEAFRAGQYCHLLTD